MVFLNLNFIFAKAKAAKEEVKVPTGITHTSIIKVFKIALKKVTGEDTKLGAREYIEMAPDNVTLVCIEEKGFQYKGFLSSKCVDEQWEQEK